MRNFLKNLLTDDEMKILGFLVFLGLLGLGIKFTGLTATNESEVVDSLNFEQNYEIKYDLNMVSQKELITIRGIGEKKAGDIISYRKEFGFSSKHDLKKIKGIGEITYNKIKDNFYDFESDSLIANDQKILLRKEKNITSESSKININSAAAEDLITLKGIGPKRAELILELRKQIGQFNNIEQLLEIKGIGPKTLENIKDRIYVGEP